MSANRTMLIFYECNTEVFPSINIIEFLDSVSFDWDGFDGLMTIYIYNNSFTNLISSKVYQIK